MNKKLIQDNMEAFKHWLDGGSVLLGIRDSITSIIKWYPSVTDPFEEESTSGELLVIINDDYCTYRKALVEGKIVEFRHEKMGFEDWTIVNEEHIFQNVVKGREYRIKPEEPKFKIGDFIRQTKELGINVSRIYRIKAHISDILYSVEKNIYDVEAINAKEEYFELWKPSHKELCYFTHDTNTKTSATLREFREISKDGFYVDCFGARFIYCEPFLSSKPSWFKD